MARLFLLTLLITFLALSCVHAIEVEYNDDESFIESESPVPEGFSLPNIYNAVTDRHDGRVQARALVGLVAKEPLVAYGVGFQPEVAIEDTWNGEKDAESSATVEQKKMMREVHQLTKLIDQGKKILQVLPRKEKRLSLLKAKLSKVLDAKAKREASEKLDHQQALLDAIKKRESAMSSRLGKLKDSQSKLENSVGKLRQVITGTPQAAGGLAHHHHGLPQANPLATTPLAHHHHHHHGERRHHGRSLIESESELNEDAENDAEEDAEVDVEDEADASDELDAEDNMEDEMEADE